MASERWSAGQTWPHDPLHTMCMSVKLDEVVLYYYGGKACLSVVHISSGGRAYLSTLLLPGRPVGVEVSHEIADANPAAYRSP